VESKTLLTVDEVAGRLSIGRTQAYEYILRGEIRSVRIGRSRRVAVVDLDAFVERLREEAGAGGF